MSDFNTLLYRTISDGKEFDKLIPKSTCRVDFTGNGDTGFSVQKMAAMINKFQGHMAKVAPKLKQRSLQNTCTAIHDFAYTHFQYKADQALQVLRSPACSWSQRREGIDCKSYSIIAGSILANLGIKYYIRRIKQPFFMPELWTHVYVVVPVDQQKGNLSKGYYVIDGTVPTMNEPTFTVKDDLYMEHVGLAGALPHQGLNAINSTTAATAAATAVGGPVAGAAAALIFKKFPLSKLKSLIKGIDCWGGTAFDGYEMEENLTIMNAFFQQKVDLMNASVMQNNMTALTEAVADFKGTAGLIKDAFTKKKNEGYNSCSTANIDACIKIADFFLNTCSKALDAWINQYFSSAPAGTKKYISEGNNSKNNIEDTMGLNFSYVGQGASYTVSKFNYVPKPGNIPAFQVNDYVLAANETNSFDAANFLQGLTQVAAIFGNNGNQISGGGYDADGNYIGADGQSYNQNKTQAAGFGIVGWVLLLAALGTGVYTFRNMPDNGPKSKKETPAKTK